MKQEDQVSQSDKITVGNNRVNRKHRSSFTLGASFWSWALQTTDLLRPARAAAGKGCWSRQVTDQTGDKELASMMLQHAESL